MSKKFKSQASSSRAAASAFGSFGGFSSAFSSNGREPSALTYIAEPPDLSRISDQHLALEELKEHIASVEKNRGTLDDGFLEAWVKIYPRASIDLSRRVRQLAHLIQGSIASLVGKRIAPYLPKVVGAWIAGLYDNDRPVHRSALDSFTKAFSTEDKRSNLWKVFQSSLLDFVDDVLLHQTVLTLSDERTVKRDDAEAKYARVVGAALMLFNRILANSADEELQKNLAEIENLLASKSVWAFCSHEDPFVRRSAYILLRSALSREPAWLDWKVASSAVIGKSLSISQLGSASELSETLLLLTKSRPSKPSRKVLTLREEPRQNLTVGWKSYIEIGTWLVSLVPPEQRAELIQMRLSPIVVQYVRPESDHIQWSLPLQSGESISADYLALLSSHEHTEDLRAMWMKLSDELLEAVKLSSPEQSKDFQSSQDAICAQSKRFFALEPALLARVAETQNEAQVQAIFKTSNFSLLEGCLQVLRSRNGKPYGAAGVVQECVRSMPSVAQRSEELAKFVEKDAPELLFSPSADRLIAIMLACREWDGFAASFENVVERAMELEPEQSNTDVLQSLLSALNFNEIGGKAKLTSVVMRALNEACKGSQAHWPIITAVLQNQTSRGELMDGIFLSIIDSLSLDETVFNALDGLSRLGNAVPMAVREFQSGTHGAKLTGKLLFLTESPSEEVAHMAESIMKTFKETFVGDTSNKSKIEILHHGLTDANEESLSIESLIAIAEELLQGLESDGAAYNLKDILPSHRSWEDVLGPFLQLPPRPSTAITSPLGGAVSLVQRDLSDSFKAMLLAIPRDSARCSAAFRLASFTIRIMSSNVTKRLDQESHETLFYFVPLAVQLIDDDLSIENCNGITGLELAEQREEYLEIVFKGRQLVSDWIRSKESVASSDLTISSLLASFWETKLEALNMTAAIDYRIGEAFVKIMASADSLDTSKSADDVARICREARTANSIRSASWFAILRSSILSNPVGNRICNELIADSIGLKPQDTSSSGLRKLVLLNILLSGEEDVISTIPAQRVVFLVKHLLECLHSSIELFGLKAEIIKTLSFVIPGIAELYGSHWVDSMEVLSAILEETNGSENGLPLLVSSFRLFARLKSMAEGKDSNDDLQEAWSERKTGLFNKLASTIGKFDSSTTFHQPRDVAVDILQRLINVIPIGKLEEVSGVFGLLTAHSRAVQRTAYTLLHRYVPQIQEQVSFDVALSKTSVSLPDELVSLLLETPTMKGVSMSWGDDKMWTSMRSYLLSWKIVFDHFSNASLPVQEYYTASIKENDILVPLLEFTFDFLQKSHGRIADASKFNVLSFEPDQSESAEKETEWLLIHLYYLCLRHLANMTKNWWIDTKKRIKGPVEAWTEKYISPLVIGDSLHGVTEWVSTQDPDEERALSVRIAPKTAEIIASIPVDEESPPVSISISLPPAYPLHSAIVVGRSRVLVDEKKWKSWLLTIQGVIMFANGNLVDGLLAFRRNVQGALKGQSECAICYSVISTDMQTPNKRCATCKNTFHSVLDIFAWKNELGRDAIPPRGFPTKLQASSHVTSVMAAPRIPNLNTLRRGRGRGRGIDRTEIGHGHPTSKDRIVQGTDNDASVSRMSAVELGYLDDPLFSNRQPSDIIYHELDFAVNTTTKIRAIRSTPSLQQALRLDASPDRVTVSEMGDELHSPSYHIHPVDLRSLSAGSSLSETLPGVDTTLPTLLISECCLIYLSPTEAAQVVSFFTEHLFGPMNKPAGAEEDALPNSQTPLGLILYEPIRPDDAFGRTMVSNLATRGIQLQTLHRYASLEAQRARLREHGLDSGQAVADIDFIWERWVSEEEKERVASLEMLDEMEEWRLLARHYCIAWGWRNGNDATAFGGWTTIEAQPGH
ncbi:uncharacterized protein N7477_002476 [Penicillium maclennaniae]|uniref:uncharacterized protein n=1 Tax=Penicillium maclennaniae TaxID=1343394 RepID=UPI0025400FF1|nr:uncharacterized protein N7477_002476 [Penicillium maclennaniae]KAJ5676843.1 hypothetical protein N7477_002476 [Penicillium maclennaniae]